MITVMQRLSFAVLIVFMALFTSAPADAAAYSEGILVGRIAHIEGQLLRYVEEENDWVLTVTDAPFGLEDTLYSDDRAKAEFIMPNSTWIRVGGNTQVQLLSLNPDTTTVDVASGLARFYNRSRDAIIKVTTPFGYMVASGDTIFDLYVGDDSLEVIAIQGDLDFVHQGTRYEVHAGSSSIIASRDEIDAGNGTVDAAWDDWNRQRDNRWAERLQNRGDTAQYLPEPIRYESYTLEENGRWERVYYEGAFRNLWRPTRVAPGWRPFTAGRWTVYYGDQCWIPDEPFGYVTHHYGSWVYVEPFRAWYWAPPIVRTTTAPAFHISFAWYPGRVGWIHSDRSVGWVPLAPTETYYGYKPWGPRTVVVNRDMPAYINIAPYRHLNEAVIIDRDSFYRGRNYTPEVQRNVSRTTIVNNYRPSTVVNNTIITNFNTDKRRFSYTDAKVARKPHSTVIRRINTNGEMIRNADRRSRQHIERELTQINTGAQPARATGGNTPRLTSRLVDADKVSMPLKEMSRTPRELKPQDRERRLPVEKRKGSDRQQQDSPALRDDRSRGAREQRQIEQTPTAADREGSRRLRSPRDTENRSEDRGQQQHMQQRQQQEAQQQQQQELRRQRQEAQRQQERELRRQQQDSPAFRDDRSRGAREQRQIEQTPAAADQEGSHRLRSPRDTENQSEDRGRQQNMQQRQQQEAQRQQQQELRRQQQEAQQRQQQEAQQQQQEQELRRQQQEAQQRQQQEAQQQQQEQELRRQQQEAQQQQQQELRRQQQEAQQRQQQEAQRQQEQQLRRQQQEAQQRQQQEAQQQQEQELRRQQQEAQQQQQESQQRQQQEGQRRQREADQDGQLQQQKRGNRQLQEPQQEQSPQNQ